jgi:hypothetical protein
MAGIDGRCMKCKANKPIGNMEVKTMPKKGGNVGYAATGTCNDCGTKMFKFISKETADELKAGGGEMKAAA